MVYPELRAWHFRTLGPQICHSFAKQKDAICLGCKAPASMFGGFCLHIDHDVLELPLRASEVHSGESGQIYRFTHVVTCEKSVPFRLHCHTSAARQNEGIKGLNNIRKTGASSDVRMFFCTAIYF